MTISDHTVYFLESNCKCSACIRGILKHCPVGERKAFAPLPSCPPTPIRPSNDIFPDATSLVYAILVLFTLLIHFVGLPPCHVQKSQRVESESDRDKGNKKSEYMLCNMVRNWATRMPVETAAWFHLPFGRHEREHRYRDFCISRLHLHSLHHHLYLSSRL
jgi:hypothetical protein